MLRPRQQRERAFSRIAFRTQVITRGHRCLGSAVPLRASGVRQRLASGARHAFAGARHLVFVGAIDPLAVAAVVALRVLDPAGVAQVDWPSGDGVGPPLAPQRGLGCMAVGARADVGDGHPVQEEGSQGDVVEVVARGQPPEGGGVCRMRRAGGCCRCCCCCGGKVGREASNRAVLFSFGHLFLSFLFFSCCCCCCCGFFFVLFFLSACGGGVMVFFSTLGCTEKYISRAKKKKKE
jgi:hypothetical protein